MCKAMGSSMSTSKQGWIIKSEEIWNGKDKILKFKITGISDSDYAECPMTRRSVSRDGSGCAVYIRYVVH
eukprot:2563592-Ditylum_brightwellii.AAC.2